MSPLGKNVCRGCAVVSDENKLLFHRTADSKVLPTFVGQLLSWCLPVKIQLGDGYPRTICAQCENQLKAFYTFKQSVLKMHNQFTSRLKAAPVSNEEYDSPPKKNTQENDGIQITSHSIVVRDLNHLKTLVESRPKQLDDRLKLVDPLALDEEKNKDDTHVVTETNKELDEDGVYVNQLKVRDDLLPLPKITSVKSLQTGEFEKNVGVTAEPVYEILSEEDVEDDFYVDNRHSLPDILVTKNSIRCSYCKRGFTRRILFQMHLCTKNGRSIFQCTKCEKKLSNSDINEHLFPTLKCTEIPLEKSKTVVEKLPPSPPPDTIDNLSKHPKCLETNRSITIPINSLKRQSIAGIVYIDDDSDDNDDVIEVPTEEVPSCEKRSESSEIREHLDREPRCSFENGTQSTFVVSNAEAIVKADYCIDNRHSQVKPIVSNNLYQCGVCRRRFQASVYFEMHLCTKTGTPPLFRCTTCEIPLKYTEIRDHVDQTPKCSKPATSTSDVIAKTRNGLPKKSQHCDVCKHRFYKQAMKFHVCSDETTPISYKCDICGKSTTSFASLRNHRSRHTGLQPLTCDLYAHGKKQHKKVRNLICDVCGHKCISKRHLVKHKLNHTDEERPFECDHCVKRYKTKKKCKRHMLVSHAGIRPFICDVCGTSFVVKSKLKIHMQKHREK